MRKTIAVLGLIVSCNIYAQTADQIIKKNIENSGGLTQWKLLNSILLQGKVVLGVDEEYPIKIYQQRPNLTKTVIAVKGKESVIEGYDGKKGYAMNYAANKLQEYASYVPESFDTDFIDYEAKGFVANYLGKEKLGDAEVFKVELVKNVNRKMYYFDVANYMLLKESSPEETTTYSDFRKVGNLTMPFKLITSTPKKEGDYVLLLNRIEVNKAFPANTFKFK
ncbi:MAG: histidine kinase [Chryseobacterium sp.]|nr:MAG: histidine kinase [Chryseobacterium sp.]